MYHVITCKCLITDLESCFKLSYLLQILGVILPDAPDSGTPEIKHVSYSQILTQLLPEIRILLSH